MNGDLAQTENRKSNSITPREIFLKYIRYAPWLIISVIIMLAFAYIKLRYATPIYSISGKLLVSRNQGARGTDKFDDIFQMQGASNNLNNEMEIIRSRFMAARVVKSLGLQFQYYNKGNIRNTTVYVKDMPFELQILSLEDSSKGLGMLVTVLNNDQFRLDENTQSHYFNEPVKLSETTIFKLVKKSNPINGFSSNQFIVEFIPLESTAAAVSGNVKVDKPGDFTDLLTIGYETDNTKLGLNIVNSFMQEYQKFSLEDKKQQAENTLGFINDQLDTVKIELGLVERNLQGYREKNHVFAPDQQSTLFFGELSESNKQLTELGVKRKMIEYLIKYIKDKKNLYRLVPGILGIDEPSLMQQITEFNKLQLEHETALKTTTAANPLVVNLEAAIEKIRYDMLENLDNLNHANSVTTESLTLKNQNTNNEIKSIPVKEKQLLEVTRQQKILEELFSVLLQKKLETSISSASTISNIRVLEPAMSSGAPVSPNRKGMYIIALLIGLGLPIGIIVLLEYLNDKVKSKEDVERFTSAPVIGEVSHAEEAGALVVTKNNRKYIAEQFRVIRSNLQYFLPKIEKPVIMVTSSFSGEGKSFISTNLGAVLAVSGKRTVVLEFDIRKPKIMEGLGLNERTGVTNYIVGNINVQEIVYPVPGQENLFVLPCGPLPPNPSEMLLDEKVDLLFKELRNNFDAIIIDTAPIGLVSDAITLGKHANACMYIVRHNYTFKKQMKIIDDLYVSKKIPNLAVIINDISAKGNYGNYYGHGGYGYGYGYGYGNGTDYFEERKPGKKGLFNKIKKFFS